MVDTERLEDANFSANLFEVTACFCDGAERARVVCSFGLIRIDTDGER